MPRAAYRPFFALALLAGLAGCGSAEAPTAPAVTATSVTVGAAGNGSTTLAPGETRQLFATASQSNGTTLDVTNLASWQSSAPSVATVSPSGLLTAAAEGSVDVTATYNSVKGSVHADIRPTCTVTVSPPTALYAFGGSATVNVSVNCRRRWSARRAPWFPFVFDAATPAAAVSATHCRPQHRLGAGHGAHDETRPASRPPTRSPRTAAARLQLRRSRRKSLHRVGRHRAVTVHAAPELRGTGERLSALGVSVTTGFSGRETRTHRLHASRRIIAGRGRRRFLKIAGSRGPNSQRPVTTGNLAANRTRRGFCDYGDRSGGAGADSRERGNRRAGIRTSPACDEPCWRRSSSWNGCARAAADTWTPRKRGDFTTAATLLRAPSSTARRPRSPRSSSHSTATAGRGTRSGGACLRPLRARDAAAASGRRRRQPRLVDRYSAAGPPARRGISDGARGFRAKRGTTGAERAGRSASTIAARRSALRRGARATLAIHAGQVLRVPRRSCPRDRRRLRHLIEPGRAVHLASGVVSRGWSGSPRRRGLALDLAAVQRWQEPGSAWPAPILPEPLSRGAVFTVRGSGEIDYEIPDASTRRGTIASRRAR